MIKPFPTIENVHAFALPMPDFPHLFTSNTFAVGEGPVTLIDPGPKLPGSIKRLRKKLDSIGFGFGDIERMLFTHAHVDHAGLALEIMEAAGYPIECFIHSDDKWRILRGNHQEQIWSEETEKFCLLTGMPPGEIERAKEHHTSLERLFDPLEEVSTIGDGDEFTGRGYHLITIHTPGHTPGGCCFYEPEHKILFSGDSIIKHITPIPLLDLRPGRPRNPSYKSLVAFRSSLEKLNKLDIRFVFPGHGEYVDDLQTLISSYFRHHRRRMDRIWKALKNNPRTLYDILVDLFPKVPGDNVFLAMIEIFAHLEILINEEKAELVEPGPPALYRSL